MITLFGALLGFFSSAFPDVMKGWRETKDRQNELAILDRQMEMAKAGASQRLEEINIQNDAITMQALYKTVRPTGVKWVDALSGTVRPILTYAFFILYAVVKYAQWEMFMVSMKFESWSQALLNIWHIEDQALFATVISFWFGQRLLMKANSRWGK